MSETKKYRKDYRFSERTIEGINRLKDGLNVLHETDAVSFAIDYTVSHVLPCIQSNSQETGKWQGTVMGLTAILHAFLLSAEQVMREENKATEEEIEHYRITFLADLNNPVNLAFFLVEQIRQRPIWLRYTGRTYYLYKEGVELLERILSGDLLSRCSGTSLCEDDEDMHDRESDDSLEPSVRLYPEDIAPLYAQIGYVVTRKQEAAFFMMLYRSMAILFPKPKGNQNDQI